MKSRQKGVALTVSLFILLVVTVVGVMSINMSQQQERIAINQSRISNAQMAAEAGGISFYNWLQSNVLTNWGDASGGEALDSDIGDFASYDIRAAYFTAEHVDVDVVGNIKNLDDPTQPTSTAELRFRIIKGDALINDVYNIGMVANDTIDLDGNAHINGGMHSNSSGTGIVVSGGASYVTGTASVVGNASFTGGNVDTRVPNLQEGADFVSVPVVDAAYLAAMEATADHIYDAINPPPDPLTLNGDQGGAIYYVEGDLTVMGSFSNVTLVVVGNITHRGQANLGTNSEVDVAFIATGNIRFDGQSDSVGVFWCNGDYLHHGRGGVEGSIVAGGSISRDGRFNFTGNDNIGNPNLPIVGYELSIAEWR